jgi:hypothetical protein
MYGKFFASTFTGSMFGAGPVVFALWGYVIATAVDGVVELNPSFVSAILGTTPADVSEALAILCGPDASSRSAAEDGRRLVHEGAYQYRVVNHAHYRSIRNEEDRRVYNREAKRRQRLRENKKASVSNGQSLTSQRCQRCQPIQKQSTETEVQRDPVQRENSAGASPAPSFVDLWNRITTPPIARCLELTAKRRTLIKARLKDRPLAAWTDVFTRIEASRFCRGDNDRGWVASIEWALQPDTAAKVLEGKYDHRATRSADPSVARKAGPNEGRHWYDDCRHEPPCDTLPEHQLRRSKEPA